MSTLKMWDFKVEGGDLKSDLVDTADPYVYVDIDGDAKKTSTKSNDVHPFWEGETLSWEDLGDAPMAKTMTISIYDSDTGIDDTRGKATIDMATLLKPEADKSSKFFVADGEDFLYAPWGGPIVSKHVGGDIWWGAKHPETGEPYGFDTPNGACCKTTGGSGAKFLKGEPVQVSWGNIATRTLQMTGDMTIQVTGWDDGAVYEMSRQNPVSDKQNENYRELSVLVDDHWRASHDVFLKFKYLTNGWGN